MGVLYSDEDIKLIMTCWFDEQHKESREEKEAEVRRLVELCNSKKLSPIEAACNWILRNGEFLARDKVTEDELDYTNEKVVTFKNPHSVCGSPLIPKNLLGYSFYGIGVHGAVLPRGFVTADYSDEYYESLRKAGSFVYFVQPEQFYRAELG